MGEKFPPAGNSVNVHPTFNPSVQQQKWQSAITQRTIIQRNLASLVEGFFITHRSKISILKAEFDGPDIFLAIAKACIEVYPIAQGDPTYRKAVQNLLNKTSTSGDEDVLVPRLTQKEAEEIMTTLVNISNQRRELKKQQRDVVKFNLLSLISGDIPIVGQLDSLSYSVKHVGLQPGALKNPLDLGAQSDNPSDWLQDLSFVHTYPRAIAWNPKVGIRHKDFETPMTQYLAAGNSLYDFERYPKMQAQMMKPYTGGKYWIEHGGNDEFDFNIKGDHVALDMNLFLLTGTVPDRTGGRVIPTAPVTVEQVKKGGNRGYLYEGVYLQPLLFFYAKAYGRTSNPTEYWKTCSKYRLQGFQEDNLGIAYLVPVNPITGGASAPGIPVAKVKGSASDAVLLARKYFPHVMSMDDGDNPNLHPDLRKALGKIGQTDYRSKWETAPQEYKSSQRYVVLIYSVWTWPQEHLMSMSNAWKTFDPDYAESIQDSRRMEETQNKILQHFLQPNTGSIAINKSYSVKGTAQENQLLYGRPSAPNHSHQTDMVEIYIMDASIESGIMEANKAIRQFYLSACQRWEKEGGTEDATKKWNKDLIVVKCAFGILNSALWIRKGGFKSMENSVGYSNTMEKYGVPSYFPEEICQAAISIIAPYFAPASPNLAMKVPINDVGDVGTVLGLFTAEYGSMPELIVPDSPEIVVATKDNNVWWPKTINGKKPSGASLQTNMREVAGSRTDKNPFAILNFSDVRPFFPYYEYTPNLKLAGRGGNILEIDNIWSTKVVRRLPILAKGVSNKWYGKGGPASVNVSMASVDAMTVEVPPPAAEDFETVKAVAVGTGGLAVIVGMMLLGRKWGL